MPQNLKMGDYDSRGYPIGVLITRGSYYFGDYLRGPL